MCNESTLKVQCIIRIERFDHSHLRELIRCGSRVWLRRESPTFSPQLRMSVAQAVSIRAATRFHHTVVAWFGGAQGTSGVRRYVRVS